MSQNEFRDQVAKYGVFLGRRDTYKRKALLVATLKQEIEPYGYPVKGIADKVRFSKAINIHIGNVDHAQTLVVAHYDQPNRMFFAHGEFDPFYETRHLLPQLFSENVVQIVVLLVAMVSLTLINQVSELWVTLVSLVLFTVVLLYTFVKYPKGLKNRYNFNKNNSSLFAILEFIKNNPKKTNIAFILTDNQCLNHHGDVMVKKMLEENLKKARVIHLDSVGKGSTLQVACKIQNEDLADKVIASYEGSLKTYKRTVESEVANRTSLYFYEKAVSLSVGELRQDDFVVLGPQTPNDTDIDENLIHEIARLLEKIRNQ